jgi:amino acid transporter
LSNASPRSLREWIFGRKLDPLQPQTRRHIVLVAFLAWIGLGADGLSSSCYGPAEAFLALGEHTHFALYLAIATAVTVFVIALAYNQVIELFPSGGGGYKAATQLIGPYAGLVSGSALIVDYVLTIAISVASGMDALFSMVPAEWLAYKLDAALALTTLLLVLNLRGLKESILVLMPIFLGFFLSHAALIVYGIHAHAGGIGTLWPDTLSETRQLAGQTGWYFVVALFLRAFSVGGGTYTGIEAVSNSVNVLAEPRVRTGHWTMFYMAASLAFTAAGIILLYLLWDATPVEGQTLNAVVFRSVLAGVFGTGEDVELALAIVLALEAGLLLVAANTGFIGGPAVLAAMASDRWVPRQFRQLSSRLVTQHGLGLMGGAALLVLLFTRGDVSLLVVLYSINVFITFSLSLFGLCRYWWEQRLYQLQWRRSFVLSLLGFAVTGFILSVLLAEKFMQGGWVTLLITGSVMTLCLLVHRHYEYVRGLLVEVDRRYEQRKSWDYDAVSAPLAPEQPTAVLLIGGSRGAGMHLLQSVLRLHPGRFRNFVFVTVGEVDKESFATERTLKSLQARIEGSLAHFTSYCVSRGLASRGYSAYGADPQDELTRLTLRVLKQFPDSVCFASKLVFRREGWFTRILHNQMPLAMQRRLSEAGREMHIVPITLEEAPVL